MFGGGIQPADHFVAVIFAVPAAGIVSAVVNIYREKSEIYRSGNFTRQLLMNDAVVIDEAVRLAIARPNL
jgi:hypothetical protein